jgi:hypothetical protein
MNIQLPPADRGHVLQLSDFRRVQVGRGVQAIRVYTGNTSKFEIDGFGKTFLGLVFNLRAPGQQHVDILWGFPAAPQADMTWSIHLL